MMQMMEYHLEAYEELPMAHRTYVEARVWKRTKKLEEIRFCVQSWQTLSKLSFASASRLC